MKNKIRMPVRANGIRSFNKIVEAAKKLFAEKGYSNTSVNEVIEHAEIATGTFYQYFDDKVTLYEYLLYYYHHEIRKVIREAVEGLNTRKEIEVEGLKAFLKYICSEKLAYKIIWESMFIEIELFREYYKSFAESYIKNLQKAVDSGEIYDDYNLETVAYSLMGIANFTGLQALFKPGLCDSGIDQIAEEAIEMLDRGLFRR